MVNKIKKFFKSIGKSSSSSTTSSASMSSANGGYPLLTTIDNQFCHQPYQQQQESHHSRSNNVSLSSSPSFGLGMDSGMAMAATEGSVSSFDSTSTSPYRNQNAIRWGLLLPKIPRLVAEATAASSSANSSSNNNNAGSPHSSQSPSSSLSQSDDNAEMNALLEILTQMAPKELQTQIAQYYLGDASAGNSLISSNTPTVMISNWEQRKVFRQCRRSLLLCWKFIIAQLNDEATRVPSELKETYFQLIGLIAERVEFNLSGDMSASSSTASSSAPRSAARRENNSGHMMGWTVNSPTATSTTSSINSIDIDSGNASDNTTNTSSNGDEGVDGERDLYLYRCLLVATFKYVVENIEGAKLNRRSWITLTELQFFAKVIAICFFRIPIIQRMVIDQIYFTYRQKRWTNTATSSSSSSDDNQSASSSSNGGGRPTTPETLSQSSRRRSSSRLGSGVTFAGSLSRWSEFEGHVLSESTADETKDSNMREDAAAESNQSSHQQHQASNASLPTRAAMDKFKRTNPTLYRWSRYVPYLAPYADNDVFRMNDSMRTSWLEKLSHDGEFFAVFMGHYAQHAETCAVGEIVWSCLPGYPLLIRVSLLLLKEASWSKWLYMRENTSGSSAPSSMMMNGLDSPSSNQQDERDPFELKSIRGIGMVFEFAVHWLRNKELLESCTLAVYECTNVLNSRSVSFCLTRFEEWFSATAALVPGDVEKLVYKLPASFTGQTFAIGIRLMLSSESFEILNRVLTFLYNRMEYFDGDLRQSILKVLVQRHMFLFLHWNVDVRSNYHHLLVYKLIRVNRYFLDSPIDHLLIGRHAVSQIENSISVANGFDEFDDHLGGVVTPYASQYHSENGNGNGSSSGNNYSSNRQYQISANEFSALRTEQALWRAFDACIGAICVQERRNAKEGNRKYQYEIQCARSRAVAFQKLNRNMADELNPSSSVNEGLPDGKPWLELDLLDDELHREPPYYLRYLPAEEVSSIDELRRLASTLRYPPEFQVYAAASLRHYSDLLKKYYQDLSQNKYVEAPPLGFV